MAAGPGSLLESKGSPAPTLLLHAQFPQPGQESLGPLLGCLRPGHLAFGPLVFLVGPEALVIRPEALLLRHLGG